MLQTWVTSTKHTRTSYRAHKAYIELYFIYYRGNIYAEFTHCWFQYCQYSLAVHLKGVFSTYGKLPSQSLVCSLSTLHVFSRFTRNMDRKFSDCKAATNSH